MFKIIVVSLYFYLKKNNESGLNGWNMNYFWIKNDSYTICGYTINKSMTTMSLCSNPEK